jgi:uncharacterized protein (DUF934 family)
MTAIIAWLYRTGLRKGAKGGNPAWLVIALAAYILRKDRERRRQSVITVPLQPGEDVIVSMRNLGSSVDS